MVDAKECITGRKKIMKEIKIRCGNVIVPELSREPLFPAKWLQCPYCGNIISYIYQKDEKTKKYSWNWIGVESEWCISSGIDCGRCGNYIEIKNFVGRNEKENNSKG